jgi:hypothetical protein
MPLGNASLSLRSVIATLLFAAGGQAMAASSYVIGNVNRVLMTGDDTFGGCMAALSVDPQTVLPGCQSWWVTFSCSGAFTDVVRAYRMADVAELALATGKQVQVFFRDDTTHNGYCFAYRIDVLR